MLILNILLLTGFPSKMMVTVMIMVFALHPILHWHIFKIAKTP